MKTKYIFSVGELSRKDNSLYFKREDGKYVYIPVEGVREIYCMNEVSINTKLLDFLSRNQIVVHFFNYHQGYSGTFYPKESLVSGKLIVKQALAYQTKRLEIAKAIVAGIGDNMQAVLGHYSRHGNEIARDCIKQLNLDIKSAKRVSDVKRLLAIEGGMWQKFYGTFNSFLREDFVMNTRVKRPPDNPINAMISFGNMFLYTKTISQIYQTHLEQTISFLHEPSSQRFSLSLDLAEVFKPAIVFKTIFDCINNRKIQVDKHFDKKYNYCLLNEEGRKKFTDELQKKMDETFMHSKLKRRVTYNTALKLEGYKLIKTIMEDETFVPFSMKELR
jgi:CRISPR-associated endonuclease Cas1